MGAVNKAILIGNLGRDAELRYTPGGTPVAKFSIATTEVWTDKAGHRQERTTWHQIALWGKVAEALSEYLVKGKQVYVEGRIQTDDYTDKEGVKRRSTTIRADQIVLLGSAPKADDTRHVESDDVGHGEPSRPLEPALQSNLSDDDIPF